MWQRLLMMLVFFASLLPTSVHAQSDIAQIQLTNRYAANELVRVIVSLRSTEERNAVPVSPAQLATRQRAITRQVSAFRERNRALFHSVHREFSVFPTIAVTVLRRDIERLAALPDVVRIDEDIARPAVLDESGELIHSRAVIEGGYGGAGSTVVVLDTGVKADHPFLDGQVIAEACFSTATDNGNWTSLCPGGTSYETGTGKAAPCALLCDHGTHVAGIIAGKESCINCSTDDQVQMSGVAPEAKIIAVQVFSRLSVDLGCRRAGQGPAPCVLAWDSDVQAALQWVFNNRNAAGWGRVVAVNMSLGGGQFQTACDAINTPYATWIDALRSVEIASVISSGNNSFSTAVTSPACIQSAIAVGATMTRRLNSVVPGSTFVLSRTDGYASFSNTPASAANRVDANGNRLLDLVAPGSNIYSSVVTGNGYATMSGTSMAAPHVAGAFAILKSIQPGATVRQVLQTLQTTGVALTHSNGLVASRIDLAAAVKALKTANATTQLSKYAVDFGLVTKDTTVSQQVGIQTRELADQTLNVSITGVGFTIGDSTCRNYLDDQIASCAVTVSFRPTSARDLQLSTGTLTFRVNGDAIEVGLVGRNSLTTPDVGLTQTRVAQSRTPTRTATPRPTTAPLAATLLAAATRTHGIANGVATQIALARTQFVIDDRTSATAERTQGLPTRTRTMTTTRTATATAVAIVQTIAALQTATRSASDAATATRKLAATQTALAVTHDRLTATAERALGSPTRTPTPTQTPSASRTVVSATASPTAANAEVTRTATFTTDIVGVEALPAGAGYAVIEHGSAAAASAFVVVDESIATLNTVILPGESAQAVAPIPASPGSYVVGGKLSEGAMYLQRYAVIALTPVPVAAHLEAGNGTISALYVDENLLYAALRYRTTAAGPERYELRTYDIRSPTDIVPVPGMQVTLPGPATTVVGVPGSNGLLVVGQKGITTAGYVHTYLAKRPVVALVTTLAWPRPLTSAVVQSTLDGARAGALVTLADRTGITIHTLNPATGVLSAVPTVSRSGPVDMLALDASQGQIVAARYDATSAALDKTSLQLWDVSPAGVRLRASNGALPGSGTVSAIDASAGRIVVAAGRTLSLLAAADSLAATPTASHTATASPTPTETRTATLTRTRTVSPTPTMTGTAVAETTQRLNAGTAHTCLLKSNGTVVCWGDSAYGQTGGGVLAAQTTPRPVTIGRSAAVRQIAGGWDHHCARTSDGVVTCWGDNSYGELGDGTTGTSAATPVVASVIEGSMHIAVGWHHACSITTDRTVVCWGWNAQRQLGNSVTVDAVTPQVVFDVVGAKQLALGATHACALLQTGKVMCWGGNSYGQLGQGNTNTYTKAIGVALTGVTSISASNNHTCAVTSTRNVYCWGANTYGQSGGTVMTSNVLSPTLIKRSGASAPLTLANVAGVETSTGHSCAYDTAGAVYCWGDNFYGQLAKDPATVFSSAIAASVSGFASSADTRVVELALGEKHTCALQANDTIKCWGNNQYGQLGNGATGTTVVTTPVEVVQ